MQELLPSLRTGQHVDVRGEPWLVVHAEPFERVTLVTLRGLGADNLGDSATVVSPFDRVQVVAPRTGLVRRSRRRVLEAAAAAVAESARWNDCWTAASARIDLRPWQQQPARAVVGGHSRILLADAVGLGKTIQALLIVSELLARGLARRVLILTPASLREQWALEMSDRFGLNASVFDQSALASTTSSLPPGVNPWSTASLIVSSIDLVKRPEVRVAVDAATYDVLVVDEAHHLTPGSDRGAAVADLAARTPWVVLLTATPHSGDDAAYRFLRSIGAVDSQADLLAFRRTAENVRARRPRHERFLGTQTTDGERALLDETRAYAKAVWGGYKARPGADLVAAVIARRATTTPAAALRTLERRLALIKGQTLPELQPLLPWDEEDCDDAGVPDQLLGIRGLDDLNAEVSWLQRLVELAATAASDSSKIRLLRKLLGRTSEHVIVFSEYRDVVAEVASAVSDVTTTAVLHGGLSAAERRQAIRAFTDGRVRTLIATDAAGEGLNLHARCRLVVNLDLPWSPLRLEQRIGRVDRLGQSRTVHAVYVIHRRSFEDDVLARLEWRRARAEAVEANHVSSSAEHAAARERHVRSLIRSPANFVERSHAAYAVEAGRQRGSPGVMLMFASDLVDGSGRRLRRAIVPLRVALVSGTCRRLRKSLVRRLADHPAVRATLEAAVAKCLAETQEDAAISAAGFIRRHTAIIAALDRGGADHHVQASLFERRTEQRAQARTIAACRNALQRRSAAAKGLLSVTASAPRLVAAWLEQ